MYQILKDFTKTNLFKEYQKHYNLICILISGSRSYGTEDEDSDYDITMFSKDKKDSFHNKYLHNYFLYKNEIEGQWALESIESLEKESIRVVLSVVLYSHTEDQVIVFDKEEYQKYKNNSYKILVDSYKKDINNKNTILNIIKNLNKPEIKYFSKRYYVYLIAWYLIKNKKLTEDQISLLKILKKIEYIENFEQKYKNELEKSFMDLKESINYFKE